MIIMAGTWEKAERLFYEIRETLERRSRLKVYLVHGGAQEDSKAVSGVIMSCCSYFISEKHKITKSTDTP